MKKTFSIILLSLLSYNVNAQDFTDIQLTPEEHTTQGKINFIPQDKWQFAFSTGISFSNFKAPTTDCNYRNIKALSNYYTLSTNYKATKKMSLYSSVTYLREDYKSQKDYFRGNLDGYLTTFGLNYQITPSLSVGFQVSTSKNVNPYYGYYYGY